MAVLVSGLGGAAGYGENFLVRNDDGFQFFDISGAFSLGTSAGIDLFGPTYTGLFVNNNGSVSFGSGLSSYTPTAITADGAVKMLAPFWADVDTRSIGSVYVDLDTALHQVTVTWLNVGYFGGTDKTNSFQLILTDLGDQGFLAEYRYSDINWTTGNASGGVGGLGGTVATAGWTAANGQNAFQLPQSGNQNQVLNLENSIGNSGEAGVWQFLIAGDEVNTGGRVTAQRLFNLNGELAFFSDLAFAAYSLADFEVESVEGAPSNNPSAEADEVRHDLNAQVRWLTQLDLPSLTPFAAADPLFPVTGLSNGLFVRSNAAALVSRSSDALFLTFRGTNDGLADSGFGNQNTPDVDDWDPLEMSLHFSLFLPLIRAIKAYVNVAANGIDHIYVSGHSLGASMVEALLDVWADRRIEATTFASPGYGLDTSVFEDKRIMNLWIHGDPILDAAAIQDNEGDENTIYNVLTNADGGDLPTNAWHSALLYRAYASFFNGQGVDLDDLRKTAGGNFNSIYCDASVTLGTDGGVIAAAIAETNDKLLGAGSDDILLGGDGNDELRGRKGNDWLIAGIEDDMLFGGKGNDTMTGGFGVDTFKFNPADSGTVTTFTDVITDFVNGQDKIDLREIDASDFEGMQRLIYIGDGTFHGGLLFRVTGEVRVSGGVIEVDMNGNGVTDFAIEVTSTALLGRTDFLL